MWRSGKLGSRREPTVHKAVMYYPWACRGFGKPSRPIIYRTSFSGTEQETGPRFRLSQATAKCAKKSTLDPVFLCDTGPAPCASGGLDLFSPYQSWWVVLRITQISRIGSAAYQFLAGRAPNGAAGMTGLLLDWDRQAFGFPRHRPISPRRPLVPSATI